MKIWLVGMMGSGKTSVGEKAASNLDVPFADTDHLIEQRVGSTIATYWTERGERAFRRVEREVVAELEDAGGIVATGGGAVMDEANRAVIARSGVVIWLDARPESLVERIGDFGGRPLLEKGGAPAREVLASTLDERSVVYRELADHRIATDELSAEEVARRIEALWKL